MAQSKTSVRKAPTKKSQTVTEQPAESATATSRKNLVTVRRVLVQYTPRIPAARCPWC